MEYLNRLRGYDDNVALKFSINFREIRTEVAGTMVQVTEEVIVEVIGLPHTGNNGIVDEGRSLKSLRSSSNQEKLGQERNKIRQDLITESMERCFHGNAMIHHL
jgi:hypothetical protein